MTYVLLPPYEQELVRERVLALGRDSIYNLTGLVRAFPLDSEDLPSLENRFTFYTHFLGRAEELALRYTGANPPDFSAVMCSRVTSAMLAVMLGTLQRDDRVLSLVPKGRSHPSVQQAVELVGAAFREVRGMAAMEQALEAGNWTMLVITPLTRPSITSPPSTSAVPSLWPRNTTSWCSSTMPT